MDSFMQQEIKENNKIKRMKQNYSPKTSLLVASVEGSVVTLKSDKKRMCC
jgi:hypothetical protein